MPNHDRVDEIAKSHRRKFKHRVWFIPTPLGITSFGWQPRFIAEFDNRDDAMECAYLEGCDDPAPDKAEYGNYYAIKVRI